MATINVYLRLSQHVLRSSGRLVAGRDGPAREMMRALFDVTAQSPLHSRSVRNSFEHMDERVHQWLHDVDPPSIIDQWIGRSEWMNGFKCRVILRTFFYDTGVVTVGPDSVELFPLFRESDRLYLKWRDIEGEGPHPDTPFGAKSRRMPGVARAPK